MALIVAVYRSPMRSRIDAVEPQATIDPARRLGLCGFGQSVSQSAEQERLVPSDRPDSPSSTKARSCGPATPGLVLVWAASLSVEN